MDCKFCGAELEADLQTCPCCGGNLEDNLVIDTEMEEEVVDDTNEVDVETEFCIDDESGEETEETEETATQAKRRPLWQVLIAIGCCVALIVALLLTVLNSLGISLGFKANDILYKDSYIVSDEAGERASDKVVAKIGDMKLTNGELQVYYTLQFYEFTQYYGSVLSYIGLDTSVSLAEQVCYFDETLTWQQYFINVAIETWQNYAVLNMLADEEDIEMTETDLASIQAIPEELEAMAKQYSFGSADAFIKENYGASTDVDAYVNYMRTCYLGEYYYSLKNMELLPTNEDIEAYYEAHQADFTSSGITKDSGPIADVRHILIQPEGGETDAETNTTVYSDDAWAKALADAEALLEQWKNGAADEDSFAALASEYTDDTGSASNGGLYEDITKDSSYVEPFLKWAIDESREVGDTGIVKTQFGYHIMYYVFGEPQWIMAARTQLLSERVDAIIATGSEKWPMNVNYKAISISANAIVK